MSILSRIDAALDGCCPCGAPPRPGSPYCSYDCEPTPAALDGDYHPPTAMRWRPDLVNASDDTHLTRIDRPGDRNGYTGRYNPSIYQHTDRPAWHLRLDNGHRYVGCDIPTEDLGDDGIIPAEMVERIQAAWVRLERDLNNTRHLEADDLPGRIFNGPWAVWTETGHTREARQRATASTVVTAGQAVFFTGQGTIGADTLLPPEWVRQTLAEMDRHVTEQLSGVAHVFNRVAQAADSAMATLRNNTDQVHAAIEADPEPPSDPMERALWLRRNRNTGPNPPRLDGRRHRRNR
jgi:hypothetical protein